MPLYKLGKYILIRKLNSGGMAEIYLAKSFGAHGMDRLLAVKRILPKVSSSGDFIKMFIDEAKLASKLSHPNISQIYELGRERETYYIALELVDGKDLRTIFDKLAKSGRIMPLPMAVKIVADICEGLDYAHQKCDDDGLPLNIVHRDVSLQNVMVSFHGDVKVIDFGVAKASVQSTETRAGVLKGKIGYMPPEQVAGQDIARRGDIFATGVILWELITSSRLFKYHTEYQSLERVRLCELYPPSAINPKVPRELEEIVLKALTRDPDDRYNTAQEFHDDLLTYLVKRRELPTTREIEQFMQELFDEEIRRNRLELEEADKITPDIEGLIDMAELDEKQVKEDRELGQPKVVRSETATHSMSKSVHQSGSRRSGTNYVSGAMSFFGSGEEAALASSTIQEMSPEALAELKKSLGESFKTTLNDSAEIQNALEAPTINEQEEISITELKASSASTTSIGHVPENTAISGHVMQPFRSPFLVGPVKSKILLGAVVAIFVGLLIGIFVWLLAPTGRGSLLITTEPSGLNIDIDNVLNACKSPCTLTHVEAGTHKVTVHFPGVRPVVRTVKVAPNQINTLLVP